jgi:pimeloyl-ACP methyl ester carboxylesterase
MNDSEILYTPIAGTNEKHGHSWVDFDSLFDRHLDSRGFGRRARELRFWSAALAGTWFTFSGHQPWIFGGEQLRKFLETLPVVDDIVQVVLIGHSYGGAVIAYALAGRPMIRVRAVITMGTPLRRDLDPVWTLAEQAIALHVHMYGTGLGSWIRFAGQRGRFMRKMPWLEHNLPVKGGHSGVFRKAKHIPQIDRALCLVRDLQGFTPLAPPPPPPPSKVRRGIG